MAVKRPRFRLDVLGRLQSGSQHELTIMAEFEANRVLEHVKIEQATLNDFANEVSVLTSFVESNFPPDYSEDSLRKLGSKLFNLLFCGDVKRLFDRASGRGTDFLPLLLCVEDYRIGGWPWEYLFDESRRHFICQEFYPVCRGIFTLDNRIKQPSQTKRKIRILVVVGVSPSDPEATPQEQLKWIKEVLTTNLNEPEFELGIVRPKDPRDLQRALREYSGKGLDIFHFFGHAAYDTKKEKGFIVLRNGPTPHHYYADDLGRLLADSKAQLVFLNACETARSSQTAQSGQTSVAAAMLSRGIPAVIAAQFSMPDVSSHYLASMVYNALSTGLPLIDALRDGRQAMGYSEGSKFFDWGIPVLYSFDPDIVVFNRTDKSHERGRDTGALGSGNVIRNLASGTSLGKPSVFVALKTRRGSSIRSKARVAIVDIDTKVGFLPELVEEANQTQRYFEFKVAYLPFPTSTFGEHDEKAIMFIPKVEKYLATLTRDLGVHHVCCLTACRINDGETSNLLTVTARGNSHVSVLSTFGLRGYAQTAKVSFPKAVLFLCLGAILVMDDRWDLDFHPETKGCLLDYCNELADMIQGLTHMKFDHPECRGKVKDQGELIAIDSLLAFDL
jgi:hypothetical protein